ncbi:hypothetical protein LX32DRAFT_102074 [Colletotrichum zoysiae]|uniref:Secreted protein n=1 Tax=Colletotrichum zoysiae TaxID=1216348 RepID=A0AAD9HQ42_9PEZI|nr:hypothetical protein LX32DRAFT_102074 [Colletotrichum zoysiae]
MEGLLFFSFLLFSFLFSSSSSSPACNAMKKLHCMLGCAGTEGSTSMAARSIGVCQKDRRSGQTDITSRQERVGRRTGKRGHGMVSILCRPRWGTSYKLIN